MYTSKFLLSFEIDKVHKNKDKFRFMQKLQIYHAKLPALSLSDVIKTRTVTGQEN